MKYTLETSCAPCSLEEFAEKHGLELVVRERVMDSFMRKRGIERYLAEFKNVEVRDGSMLWGAYGNGNTPEEAIKDYAAKILGKYLVFGAYSNNRREFATPNEWK